MMTELAKRITFAVPAAALFLFLVWMGGWYVTGLIILITFFTIYECITIFSSGKMQVDGFFPFTFGLWILLSPQLPHALPIGITIFVTFVIIQLLKKSDHTLSLLSTTLFSGFYAPVGFLTFLIIRGTGSSMDGFLLVLALLLAVWGNDIFAYFGGKWLGKHLLVPDISPKKTWEGFWFGFAGALAGICIPLFILPYPFPLTFLQVLPIVLIVSIFGPLGDLTASQLKREAGLKDASHLLPGHGGFLDRFDALILATPGVFIYLLLLQVLGYVAI